MSYEQYVSQVKQEFVDSTNYTAEQVEEFFSDEEVQEELHDSYEIFVGADDEDIKSAAYPEAVASDLAMMI